MTSGVNNWCTINIRAKIFLIQSCNALNWWEKLWNINRDNDPLLCIRNTVKLAHCFNSYKLVVPLLQQSQLHHRLVQDIHSNIRMKKEGVVVYPCSVLYWWHFLMKICWQFPPSTMCKEGWLNYSVMQLLCHLQTNFHKYWLVFARHT